MRLLLRLVALLCALCSTAAQSQAIFQKNFYGDSTGTYMNRDPATGCSVTNNCTVALNGADSLPILINPWEPVSINILCAQIIFLPNRKVSANTMFFAGNSYSPDIMVWGVPQPNGGADPKMCYPPGTSFPFPAAASGAPPNKPGQNNFTLPHLDVHVQGQPSTVDYVVYLSVWYTKNPQ